MGTNIYHITHLDNLCSIFQAGGLVAKGRQQNIKTQSIAYEHIQDRRASKTVPCSMGGNLHDYVPFYFAPRSPMLYTIHRGNVSTYQGGQSAILYLVTTAEDVAQQGLAFAFTDGHAVIELAEFYTELSDLVEAIDWQLMRSKYWFDSEDDPSRKFRRQAEFLIHSYLPIGLIKEIGVFNSHCKGKVEQMLVSTNHNSLVQVHKDWYY